MEGLSGGRGGGGGMGMDPNDIFEMFGGGFSFGFDFGPGGFGAPRRKKGQDTVIPYEVTLEDLYNGKSVKMNLEKDALCSACSGLVPPLSRVCVVLMLLLSSGAKGNAKPRKCVKCEGKGWTFVHSQVISSSYTFIGRADRIYHRLGGTRSGLRELCALNATVVAKSSVKKIGEAHPIALHFHQQLIGEHVGARNARVPKQSKKRHDKNYSLREVWQTNRGSFLPVRVTKSPEFLPEMWSLSSNKPRTTLSSDLGTIFLLRYTSPSQKPSLASLGS